MNKKILLIIILLLIGMFFLQQNHPLFATEPFASTQPDDDDDDGDDGDDGDYTPPDSTAPMNSPIRKNTRKSVIKDLSLTAPKLFKKVNNK